MSGPIQHATQRTRLLLLADALDDWPKERFNMCGFRECALGLAVQLFGADLGITWRDREPRTASGGNWIYVAQDLFGTTANESHELFYPGHGRIGDESPKEMAAVIRAFLARSPLTQGAE